MAVEADPRLPLVVIVTRIASGSGEDPPSWPGLAHLVEHLGFGWVGAGYDAEVQAVGGDTNGWTEPDATVFTTVIPRDQQPLAYALEGARLVDGPRPDSASIELARRVVTAEARVTSRSMLGRVRTTLFPEGDPWHRPALGDPAKLAGITPEEVHAWVRAAWRPERVSVAIVGDIDASAVASLRSRLAAWETPEPPPTRPPAPGPGHTTFGEIEAWRTVPRGHVDRPALELLAVTVGGEAVTGPDRGLFWADGQARWLGFGRRLEAAKGVMEAKLLRARDDLEGRARLYASCLAVGEGGDCVEAELARYRAVTVADLRRVRRAWLR